MRFWRNRPLVIAVLLIVVLMVLLVSTANTDEEAGPVSVIGRVMKPVQSFFYNITSGIGNLFEKNASKTELQEQNLEMQERILELESELKDYDNTYAENQRLKELLNFVDDLETEEYLTAKVIGTSPGAWFDEFVINVGSDHGIQNNMIVYTSSGLVGRVVYTGSNYARVISLIHDNSGVPVLVERTRDNGVLKSAGRASDEDMLEVYYLTEDADVRPGDRILTSGLGGIYPKGILVGTVTEVSTNPGEEQAVYVKSDVDFKHMEEVVVVLRVYEEVD